MSRKTLALACAPSSKQERRLLHAVSRGGVCAGGAQRRRRAPRSSRARASAWRPACCGRCCWTLAAAPRTAARPASTCRRGRRRRAGRAAQPRGRRWRRGRPRLVRAGPLVAHGRHQECRSRLAGPSNRPSVVEHLTYAIHMPVAGCAAAQSVSILTCSAHGATCCSMARSHRSFSCQVCNGRACVTCLARAPVPRMGGTAARRRARGWRRGRRAVPRAGACGMVPLQRGEPHRAQRAAGLLQRQARRAGPGGVRARSHPAPSAGAPRSAGGVAGTCSGPVALRPVGTPVGPLGRLTLPCMAPRSAPQQCNAQPTCATQGCIVM